MPQKEKKNRETQNINCHDHERYFSRSVKGRPHRVFYEKTDVNVDDDVLPRWLQEVQRSSLEAGLR